jgi:hypothetical protein
VEKRLPSSDEEPTIVSLCNPLAHLGLGNVRPSYADAALFNAGMGYGA